MIVKNEERYLQQCLDSVASFVDEICIVDTGSTDRTVEIAKSFGARIEHREWRDDFAWARNEAIAMAAYRWIVMLDADEELSPQSGQSLRTIAKLPADKTALYVRCDNLSDDYKGTGSISHLIARIMPNNPKVRFISPIHEYVSYESDVMGMDTCLSDVVIIHHGYLQGIVKEREKAERNFALIRRATEKDPLEAFNWYNLGMTAHVVKDYEQAIMAFEKMRSLLKGQPRAYLPQGLITLAECYSDARNDEVTALSIIDEALAASPNLTNAFFSQGRVLSKMGRIEDSRQAFLKAIDAKKFRHLQFIVDDQIYLWKAQHCIGVSYANEKRWDEALSWYRKGLENQPDVYPLQTNVAYALEGAERFAEAEAAFKALHERFADETSLVHYINYLLRRKNYQLATALMEEHYETVSNRTAATFMMAAAQMAHRASNTKEERRALERAYERCPDAGPVLDALEAFYRSSGDAAALDALYENEFQHEPVETPDYVRRAFRLIALERFDEALETAQAGLRKDPAHAELRYNSAAARARLGDIDGAQSDLAVIQLDGTELAKKAAMLRGTLLRQTAKYAESIAVLDAAFSGATNVDAFMLKANCLELLGRIDDAAATLEGVFAFDRQRVGVEMASMFMRAGRFTDAQVAAERALAVR